MAHLDFEFQRDGGAAHDPIDRSAVIASPMRARVLVVDDELLVVRSVTRTLNAHTVVAVTSAKQAIALFAAGERFDVVLCDLMMPDMDGMQLHQQAERDWPHLADRFVFMTGGAFSDTARAFIQAQPSRQLDKPFSANEIRACIDLAMSTARREP